RRIERAKALLRDSDTRSCSLILSASGLSSCTRLSPSFVDWASWLTLVMPSQCWRPIGLSPWLKHLGSKQRGSGSGAPKTLHRHSSGLRTKRALYVVSDALIAANRMRIVTLALSARLPTIMSYDDVAAGGLMSYGPDYPDLFRKAADMVDKILRGTKPGDI